MTDTTTQLERMAARAEALFSRPTIAMELVRLADQPQVDAQALKDCVAQDPALACKLLRVVNSSLFGLPRPCGDLHQAIGLLGIKPLKLLVLGFSLPDSLFADVAGRELQWYWTNSLTRAVAARLICEKVWKQSGDEAFIAGLLQDIGILVLLRELGAPYARFLSGVIDEKCHLAMLEQDTLGFDHQQLSASLLARWQLPARLVDAIAAPKRTPKLQRLSSPEGDLPQILHLAEMLVQLVGQHRLNALCDLLEAGKLYRGLTRSQLAGIVENLQPQVDQLASVLAVELTQERNYVGVLLNAQRAMAAISEQVVRPISHGDDDHIYNQLLTQAGELTDAMRLFLAGKHPPAKAADQRTQSHAAHYGQHVSRGFVGRKPEPATPLPLLQQKLIAAANRCRERRHELSLLLVEPNVFDIHTDPNGVAAGLLTRRALAAACESLKPQDLVLLPLENQRAAAIVSNCERRSALAIARQAIEELARLNALVPPVDGDLATTLSIGVATVSVVPKNFDPAQVVESANRCLGAARTCGTSTVKSIEV